MLRYELVSPKLIVSRTAYRVYRFSACLSILLILGVSVALSERNIPDIVAVLVKPLLFLFAVSAAITFAGMEVFLFRFDQSRPLKQAFWFLAMLVPLLGPALYCFIVYSRSDVFNAGDGRAQRASA